MSTNKIYLLLSVPMLLLFSSCLQEATRDNCPLEVRVYFDYLDNGKDPKQRGIDPDHIDRIALYAYDEAGLFYDTWVDESPVMSKDYYMSVSLLPGTYTLMAWGGNQEDDYSINPQGFGRGEADTSHSLLSLDRPATNDVTFIPHHLFFAGSGEKVTVKAGNETFRLPVVQDTYTINLSLECYDYAGNDLQVHIYDDNGSFLFDNSFVSDSVHYYQSFRYGELSSYSGMIRIMRLAEYRQPRLVIYDATADVIRLDVDLVDLLKRMYQYGLLADLDFENLYEYDIPLSFCPETSDGKVQLLVDMETWHIVIGGIIFGE